MTLKYNSKTQEFVLISNDSDRAMSVGLTLSINARGPQGEKVWFTSDHYAALAFWDVADDSARRMLAGLKADYDKSWATTTDRDFPAPRDMTYMPFQRAGIAYGVDHEHALVGDEMGLGKTVIALGIANAIEAQRVLIVCPASIRLNWKREIENWSVIKQRTIYPILKAKSGVGPRRNFYVISYDLLRNEALHDTLYGMEWDLLIMDEVHYLKSIEAQRTRAIFGGGRGQFGRKRLADKAKKIIGLTGTPLPNRPRECYTLARALCWDSIDWMSYDQFCYRFNPSRQTVLEDKVVNEERKGRLPELQNRLRCNFMVRRLKADVLHDLPDKRYEFTYVEENGAIRDVLQKERLLQFKIDDLVNPFSELMGQISTLRREMGEAKTPRIVEHVKFLLEIMELPKVVVFCHHRSVMDTIHSDLHEYGVGVVRGGMSAHAKNGAVQAFIHDPKCRIFLGQLDAAGFGIDGLQHVASHIVIAEPAWTPGTNEQVVDRCHRIGQHDNVVAQFLVVEGSLDERVLAAVLDKTQTIHQSLDKRIA